MRSALCCLASGLLCAGALAGAALCRYTVRDIGFVDLTGPTYRLELRGPIEWKPTHEQAATLESLRRESNVVAAGGVDDPAGALRWTLSTEGREAHELCLLQVGELGVDEALRRALHSPVRDAVAAQALDTFAFIVIFEGARAEHNGHLLAVLDEVEQGLRELEAQLPRPIDLPLRRLTVPHAGRDAEDVLLWSLGHDLQATEEAGVVILYGRGKLAGAARWGQGIAPAPLLAQLALVGQSCECDTDRDWVAEPNIPMAWTDRHRRSSLDALGFDPESPMVMAEVVRILRKQGAAGRDGALDSTAAIAFGYRETALDEEATAAPERLFSSDPTSERLAPQVARETGVHVVEGTQGDDWGFPMEEAEEQAEELPATPIHDSLPPPSAADTGALQRLGWVVGGFLSTCIVVAAIVFTCNRKQA